MAERMQTPSSAQTSTASSFAMLGPAPELGSCFQPLPRWDLQTDCSYPGFLHTCSRTALSQTGYACPCAPTQARTAEHFPTARAIESFASRARRRPSAKPSPEKPSAAKPSAAKPSPEKPSPERRSRRRWGSHRRRSRRRRSRRRREAVAELLRMGGGRSGNTWVYARARTSIGFKAPGFVFVFSPNIGTSISEPSCSAITNV